MRNIILIGNSGHALVVAEVLQLCGHNIIGYVQKQPASKNILNLEYLGSEDDPDLFYKINNYMFFPCIGDNNSRSFVTEYFLSKNMAISIAIHPKANISNTAKIDHGTLVCQGSCINPYSIIKKGVIINTGAIIEHECLIEEYSHIAPGSVLSGNVKIGKKTFIGANSIIKQGVKIGNNVIIGAGSVVINDVPDNETWFGNPAKLKIRK